MNFKERYVAFWMRIENGITRATDAVNERIESISEKYKNVRNKHLEWADSPYKHPFFTNSNRDS